MKKIFFALLSLAAVLLVLFLTGVIDFSRSVRDEALANGNRLMKAGRYQEALEAYERGLKENPQDPELNYNSGQALYNMGEYSRAVGYYEKSALSTPDKYINMGNCA
jgi:tetratricopeptide (TPR) repeat protein